MKQIDICLWYPLTAHNQRAEWYIKSCMVYGVSCSIYLSFPSFDYERNNVHYELIPEKPCAH
jgi:hypothetical protein